MEVKAVISIFFVIVLYSFYLMYFVTSSGDNFNYEAKSFLKAMWVKHRKNHSVGLIFLSVETINTLFIASGSSINIPSDTLSN